MTAHTLAREEIENLCAELAADADEETRIQAYVLQEMALECLEARLRKNDENVAPQAPSSREVVESGRAAEAREPAVAAPSGPNDEAITLLRAWVAGCGDEHFSTKEQCRDLLERSGRFFATLDATVERK